MIDLASVSFSDLLAPSIADDPTIRALAAALDDEFRQVTKEIDSIILLPHLEQITHSALIDLLAWQMHVDFYDPTLPIEIRRKLVKESISWHTRKGTLQLCQDVLNTFYEPGSATLQEWFEYKDPLPPNYPIDDPGGLGTWHDRYRFRIIVDQGVINPGIEQQVRFLINAYKPVSRWDEGIIRARRSESEMYVGIGSLGWKYTTIEAPIL
jgi:phage tail P2-like protein